jgi:hypothetical protein
MSAGAPTLGPYAIPGDPSTFRILISRIGTGSENIVDVRNSIARESLHGAWTGAGLTEYNLAGARCANNLASLASALDNARGALTTFAGQLEDQQSTATYLASQIRQFQSDLEDAETQVSHAQQNVKKLETERNAAALPHERAVLEVAVSTAVLRLQDAEAASDDVKAQLSSLTRAAQANYQEYEECRSSLCAALGGAHTYAPGGEPSQDPLFPLRPGPSVDPSQLGGLLSGGAMDF